MMEAYKPQTSPTPAARPVHSERAVSFPTPNPTPTTHDPASPPQTYPTSLPAAARTLPAILGTAESEVASASARRARLGPCLRVLQRFLPTQATAGACHRHRACRRGPESHRLRHARRGLRRRPRENHSIENPSHDLPRLSRSARLRGPVHLDRRRNHRIVQLGALLRYPAVSLLGNAEATAAAKPAAPPTTDTQFTRQPAYPSPTMTPRFLFLVFAWIAIIALSFSVLSDFWLPMLVGAAVITLLIRLAASPRR